MGGHFDIIKDLLSRDEIQVNCQDNLVFFIINGNTPLHILAGSNYIESFELLISDSRIDQTIKNKEGNTAKEIATIQENDEMLVLFEN